MAMIALGCDHGGFALMAEIKKHLQEKNISIRDFGVDRPVAVDYPDVAVPVARAVAKGECEKGILVCGTGIGMCIAANKVTGVRAAVCSDGFSAKYTRLHNDANILCLGGRVVGPGLALALVDLFLQTEFEGGRHTARLDKIRELEQSDR